MIKFSTNCSEVLKQSASNLQFDLNINQDTTLTLTLEDLVVPSWVLDTTDKSSCFLGIQPSDGAKDPVAIYLGQLFVHKYYTYFDISHVQNGLGDKLLIGTGVRNPNAKILENQYKKDGNGQQNQKPADKSHDTTKPIPDDSQNKDQANAQAGAGQDPSQTMLIIIIASGVTILIALATIMYCKCRKPSDVNDQTPIGESFNGATTINDERGYSAVSGEQNDWQLIDKDGVEN